MYFNITNLQQIARFSIIIHIILTDEFLHVLEVGRFHFKQIKIHKI